MSARPPYEMLAVAAGAATGELVIIKDGELFTTTLAIAAGTDTTHEAVIKLVRRHAVPLAKFGQVRFEIRLNAQGSKTEFANLSEPQAALLISFMRNSEVVVDFKVALVQEFYDMRTKLRAAPTNMLDSLPVEQRAMVSLMFEQAAIKAAQAEIINVQASHQESIARIEAKQSAAENGASCFTVVAYGVIRSIKFSLDESTAMGRKAAALSKKHGLRVDKVPDRRFGFVGSYHESMLDMALEDLYGGM